MIWFVCLGHVRSVWVYFPYLVMWVFLRVCSIIFFIFRTWPSIWSSIGLRIFIVILLFLFISHNTFFGLFIYNDIYLAGPFCSKQSRSWVLRSMGKNWRYAWQLGGKRGILIFFREEGTRGVDVVVGRECRWWWRKRWHQYCRFWNGLKTNASCFYELWSWLSLGTMLENEGTDCVWKWLCYMVHQFEMPDTL